MSETGTTIATRDQQGRKIGCGGLSHVAEAPACQRGDWSGLVVRRWGWPQKKISDTALEKNWGVLNSPLGAFTIGAVGRDSEAQLEDVDIAWPESAKLRYYRHRSRSITASRMRIQRSWMSAHGLASTCWGSRGRQRIRPRIKRTVRSISTPSVAASPGGSRMES